MTCADIEIFIKIEKHIISPTGAQNYLVRMSLKRNHKCRRQNCTTYSKHLLIEEDRTEKFI